MAKKSSLEQVAEGLALIKESREELEALATQYNEWIDEAARLGEDAYSDQLIDDKVELEAFVDDLKFLELQVRTGAITAKTFNNLKNMPAAIAACRGLLKSGPNFIKLGKDIATFKTGLNTAKASLSGLRVELSKEKKLTVDERIAGKKKEDSQKVKAEKEARELRLMKPGAGKSSSVAMPAESAAADSVDIDAIIDAENGKKKP
ncbi:MAG: hypothetical protein LBT30_02195 [Clostridiales bacterium]|jgi:hypothetical protein|nr:hypothetical protein [Clostridiales bacterium]